MEVIVIPAKGSKTGVWYNCEWCGQLKYMNTYHYNNTKHHFCSNECSIAWRHKIAYEHRPCEICGKDMYLSKKSAQRFCSDKCQNEWQKTRVGFNNPKFEGDLISCDWCDEKYFENAYKIKNQNNHFCSSKCRREWYAKVWSQQPEWKEESRTRAARIIESGIISQTQSKPQLTLNIMLDNMGIKYINEYNVEYYAVDNYLVDYNLFIEVMGDYWHCSPIRYPTIKYQQQREAIRRDKAKHTYITETYDIPILYLWESDINKNPKLCETLIRKFINENGRLQNYNSFNYHLNNDKITLNDNIVLSYSELSKDELQPKLCLAS